MNHLSRLRHLAVILLGGLPLLGVEHTAIPHPATVPGVNVHNGQIVDFGPTFSLASVETHSATATLGGTAQVPALRIAVQAKGGWPGVLVPAPAALNHWDLSTYEFLSLDIRNVDNHDVDVYVRVDNPGADGGQHCMTERIGTQPDQRVTLTIPLKRVTQSPIKLFGMNGYPQGMYASGGIDPANIVGLTIFVDNQPSVGSTFEISNIRVFGTYHTPPWATMDEKTFFPFIDRFGQFMHKDWPGKIHNDTELTAKRDAEAKQLAADHGPKTWDAWGGWANGPQLPATGHFRTAKQDGKWWLVDPDGRLFFSTGITCVGLGWASTPIDDREHWFADLPTKTDDPFMPFRSPGGKSWGGGYYAGKSPINFDFSSANLLRKYGPQWSSTYPEVVHQRLRAWGINTMGNWSSGEIAALHRTPYTRTFWYDSPGLLGGNFPDVFDPKFAPALDHGTAQFLQGTTTDPWCIGYFVDNEMAWGGDTELALRALHSPATAAAKSALVAWLRQRYPQIELLTTAWGTTWASWDAFTADMTAQPATDAARADLIAFTGLTSETYFRTVREAIKRAAPNKLYLGCRSVGGALNMAAAAAKYCDVVSYNRYCASVRDICLPGNLDAPVMIGEFHFGGLDRGPFWAGLFSADNQEDRGRKFTTYMESAIENPQIVGAHWFQYGDEATTGRVDGENAQCGFVDICDTPYAETIHAARANGETMYQRRNATK